MAHAETNPNRLIKEKSPYLLQHAHNPVDWHPWGEEAFQKARAEDKPIFLSIGYSTCHWCHVMEEESFSNPEIAQVMNERFVSIKVDREERPDVDHIYMKAVVAMTGSGGWPLSVFLTPGLKPFYGGTYFPPEDRWGRLGFSSLLTMVAEHWKKNRDRIVQSGDQLASGLRDQGRQTQAQEALGEGTLRQAFDELASRFDGEHGGFSEAPKFPMGHMLSFLLRYWKRSNDSRALQMVDETLHAMARGGMYDQLGGGFHRYSTDRQWRLPHFEKMLYDQAILARAYLEAYQVTQNREYAEVAREILDYVLRDMTAPEGAFYSAQDADSLPHDGGEGAKKSEGAFYIWSQGEIRSLLGARAAEIFSFHFGVEPGGNAPADPHGEFRGKNILYRAHAMEETTSRFGTSQGEVARLLRQARDELFESRSKRPAPHLDDKVLTDWNGLMISSFAFGSRVLNEPRYREAAGRAANFLLGHLVRKDGRLLHRWRQGEAGITAFLEDYAFLTHGLFELFEATWDARYLAEAKRLAGQMIDLFWDPEEGGFFFSGRDAEPMITRTKELYDGAIPSGNSFGALSLLRLGRLTVDRTLEERGRQTLDAFSGEIARQPSAFVQMLMALDYAIGPSREIVIAGSGDDPQAEQMVQEIYARFLPSQVSAFHPSDPTSAEPIEALVPFLKAQVTLGGRATAYVCENYMCRVPTNDISKFRKLLDG